jgi:predicted trehalose synthase
MRILAWLLAAYAVAGAIFLVVAPLVGGPLVGRLDRVTTAAQSTLASATEAADAAADAFNGFDTSLVQARTSTSNAASLSRQTSATLDALAANMSISLFGSQPLLPLADQFRQSADQLQQLGDNLDGIGAALGGNRDDIARVGTRMRALASQLASLEGRIGTEQLAGGLPLSLLFYGFLFWQLLPITAAGVGSTWLFRHTRVTVVD